MCRGNITKVWYIMFGDLLKHIIQQKFISQMHESPVELIAYFI